MDSWYSIVKLNLLVKYRSSEESNKNSQSPITTPNDTMYTTPPREGSSTLPRAVQMDTPEIKDTPLEKIEYKRYEKFFNGLLLFNDHLFSYLEELYEEMKCPINRKYMKTDYIDNDRRKEGMFLQATSHVSEKDDNRFIVTFEIVNDKMQNIEIYDGNVTYDVETLGDKQWIHLVIKDDFLYIPRAFSKDLENNINHWENIKDTIQEKTCVYFRISKNHVAKLVSFKYHHSSCEMKDKDYQGKYLMDVLKSCLYHFFPFVEYITLDDSTFDVKKVHDGTQIVKKQLMNKLSKKIRSLILVKNTVYTNYGFKPNPSYKIKWFLSKDVITSVLWKGDQCFFQMKNLTQDDYLIEMPYEEAFRIFMLPMLEQISGYDAGFFDESFAGNYVGTILKQYIVSFRR